MNNKNRFVILSTSVMLLLLSICCFAFTVPTVNVSNNYESFYPTVVIDAGHGGEDGGASTDDNVLEKDINLSIAKKLEKLFTQNGFNTKMTRSSDKATYYNENGDYVKRADLESRVDTFNSSADNVVISIHQNKFEIEKYNGAQIFYSKNNENSEALAQCIKNSIVFLTQSENERECKQAGSEILILDKTNVPAVLVECGFLSNKNEAEKLKDEDYQSKLAYCIYLGFLEFYYRNY